MCFSAQASFIVGFTLTVVGVATLQRSDGWREKPLAAVPLLFAAQQFIEGALWLRLESGTDDAIAASLANGFLLFAEILWPVLVPVAVLLVEPQSRRRRIMALFVLWGGAVAGYLLVRMIISPYGAAIGGHHILYTNRYFHPAGSEYVYLIGILAPLLSSSHGNLLTMGLITVLSFFFSKSISELTYVSLWCYFAAVSSLVLFAHFHAATGLRGKPSLNTDSGSMV
jgi:hypothetical protein